MIYSYLLQATKHWQIAAWVKSLVLLKTKGRYAWVKFGLHLVYLDLHIFKFNILICLPNLIKNHFSFSF